MIAQLAWVANKAMSALGLSPQRRDELTAFLATAFLAGADAASKAQALVVFKSLDDVLREYESVLTRMALDALKNKTGKIDFRRALKEMLRRLGPRAFEQGWREGDGDIADIEPEDLMVLRDWTDEQVGRVNDFAAWLAATDSTEATRIEVGARVALWVASMRNLGQIAKARALGDPLLRLDGDDGEESCDECQEYTGQVHRLSWWDKRGLIKRNGNDNYGCGRWEHCHHHFFHARTGALVIQ